MVERLNGLDTAMLAGETPEWHMHTGALVLLEPLADQEDVDVAERLRAVLDARRGVLGPFRYELLEAPLGLGRPVWADTGRADLGAQVHRVGVPAPGGMREVATLIGELFSSKLNRSGPLWEIWVLEGLQSGHVGLLAKVHHALMDGVRGARLFEALFDLEPDAPLSTREEGQFSAEPTPSRSEMLVRTGAFLAGTPMRALHLGADLASAMTKLVRMMATPQGRGVVLPFRAPRTSMNGPLTARRAFAFTSVSLDDIRTVKQAFGVTMNDVALALSAEVMRQYLLDRDELPDRPLVAAIPVGVHRDRDAPAGNFVAATGTCLHTDIADPIARLTAIHTSMQRAKAMQSALGDDLLIDALAVLPPAALTVGLGIYRGFGLAAAHPPIFNAIISNVPGPPVPLYSCGARLVATYTLGPLLAGCGVNITLLSYEDHVDFGIATCPDVVDDGWKLAEGIPDALAVLLKAAETVEV